jgi:hypothetical protein
MNMGSGASALFLRKNHSFHHLTGWLDIKKCKYGSIPDPERTKILTLPHTAASASKLGYNRAWKK